jgi:hypothetical protein
MVQNNSTREQTTSIIQNLFGQNMKAAKYGGIAKNEASR